MDKTAVSTDDMSFETWTQNAYETARRSDLRFGQALFNTAPGHITAFTSGSMELDPFYVETQERMYIINNFLLFSYLCWDLEWTPEDVEQMELARRMVMAEPGARR